MAQSGHGLFFQATNAQDSAPQRYFSGHCHVPPDGYAGKSGYHCRAYRHAGGRTVLWHSPLREVDVNIFGFIEIRSNAQFRTVSPNVAQGRVSGFLHHVTQIAGELQLAGTLHDVDLHLQRFTADAGPGQAGDQPNLVGSRQPIR